MPFQNRVDPFGNFHAEATRGAWMGNRGILHNDKKEIVAQWKHQHWVTCALEFGGRRREIFSPNSYSELFFLDEATAFAAGHRPCAECRRERYKEFKSCWISANTESTTTELSISAIDKRLHKERAIRGGGKVTYQTTFDNIPVGTFIQHNNEAGLYWRDSLYIWSVSGYTRSAHLPERKDNVIVITPISIVKMFQNGFKPQVHDSACS